MKYRAEIDGLRALAVIPVILFHANFQWFSGGYVGVDVFYVISGYLITTIIINDLENEKFSLVNFYERRARRILPALFFVVLISIPFAWMYLTPRLMKDFAQSLVAVATFSSNILFWHESGYFDTSAELKPLLHTWSLAVEEQYYILFPLFMIIAWRFGKRTIISTLSILFACSLTAACYAAYYHPAAAFFLLPTRGWEILLGVFCAFYLTAERKPHPFVVQQSLSVIGVLLIALAVFAFDHATPTSSFYTLIPTVGTGLIILFANERTFVRQLLSFPPIVGVGLISYSAYLWHQPILAFAKNTLLSEDFKDLAFVFVVLSLLLGWLSWKFVEKPFRRRNGPNRFVALGLAVFCTSSIIGLGYFGHISNGFPAKPNEEYRIERPLVSSNIFLLGDSHAGHLLQGLTKITSGDVLDKSQGGCIPFRNVDRYDTRFVPGECARTVNLALEEFSASKKWDTLVMSSMGPVYLDGTTFRGKNKERVSGLGVELIDNPDITDPWKVFEIGMRKTFKALSALEDKKIIFVIDVPELGIDNGCNRGKKVLRIKDVTITDYVTNKLAVECKIPRSEYDQRAGRFKNLIKSVSADFPAIKIFDPTSLFCDGDSCYGYIDDVGYLYEDSDHLNVTGSHFLAYNLAKKLWGSNN